MKLRRSWRMLIWLARLLTSSQAFANLWGIITSLDKSSLCTAIAKYSSIGVDEWMEHPCGKITEE